MRPPPPSRKPKAPRFRVSFFFIALGCALVFLLLAAAPATAAGGQLQVERLSAAAGSAEGLNLRFSEQNEGGFSLQLQVRQASLPALGRSFRDLEWSCTVSRLPGPCEGPLRLAGRAAGRLAVDLASPTSAEWRQAGRRLHLHVQGERWQLDLTRIPLRWLEALGQAHFGVLVNAGELNGRLHLPAAGRSDWRAELRLAGLGFDSPDGTRAAAGVAARLGLESRGGRFDLRAHWEAGEALFAPFYLQAPAGGIAIAARFDTTGPDLLVRHMEWRDGERLHLRGRARLRPEGEAPELRLEAESGDLGDLATAYLGGVLGPLGLGDVALQGRGRIQVESDSEGLVAFDLDLDAAAARDPGGRFALEGLHGGLHWSRHSTVESALRWRSAALYGVGLDPATLSFRSHAGRLELAAPVAIGLLGGELRLAQLGWQPAQSGAAARSRLGLSLHRIDLALLSRQFGWPPFEGQLSGSLPEASYADGRLLFAGGLRMDLFGGSVRIDDLALERPFGVAPSLAADVRFDDIDLAPLTRAFGFGEITGRLDGRIRDLRLLDWTPVAFDARLLSDRQWPGRRRISQRAVQDISAMGGGGLAAGLQTRLLRAFDDFGYERIAIGCVLRDHVCRMSGIARRGEGFLIVQGRGLPRLDVVGFRRDVDWPTLLQRLQAATRPGGIRID